jgi:predicted permease
MIESLGAFFIIIALGVLFQIIKPSNIDANSARLAINTIVIKFMLPALCFRVISKMDIDINTILFPLSAILTVFASILFAFIVLTILERFIRITKEQKGALIITAAFGNVTFFGLPILIGLYGQEAQKFPLMYDFMGAGTLLWTVGVVIASYYGTISKDGSILKDGLKSLFKTPPVWAMIFGFIANFVGLGRELPNFLIKVLEMLSAPVIPMMIFSIGLTLKVPNLKYIALALPAVIIKLIICPLIAFGIATFLGLSGIALKATIIEAGLPVMVLALFITIQYKLDDNLAALVTIMSIIVSFITIPALVFLVGKT